jgi:hypothetical protein
MVDGGVAAKQIPPPPRKIDELNLKEKKGRINKVAPQLLIPRAPIMLAPGGKGKRRAWTNAERIEPLLPYSSPTHILFHLRQLLNVGTRPLIFFELHQIIYARI